LLFFDKKFQKKKKKFFTCEFIVAACFDLGDKKRNKILIKKNSFFEKFCAKNGTKNELFWSFKFS